MCPGCSPGTPIPYESLRSYFKSDPASSWGAYVAGCLLVLAHEKGVTFPDGISILVASDVPEGMHDSKCFEWSARTAGLLANANQPQAHMACPVPLAGSGGSECCQTLVLGSLVSFNSYCAVPCCVRCAVLCCVTCVAVAYRVLGLCRQGRVLVSCPGGVCHVCCGSCTRHQAGRQGAGTAVPEGRGRQGCLACQHAGEAWEVSITHTLGLAHSSCWVRRGAALNCLHVWLPSAALCCATSCYAWLSS
jgi:hypothetical protein